MLTFLYCLDKNYNIQAYTSIISLLENIDEPIKIIILHKEPDTFLESKFYKQIKDRKNLSEIQIFNFQKEKVEFPKLSNVHVSEATYYRIYISNYIQSNQDILIYLDPDVICIKDPVKELRKKIDELKASDEIIGASTETYKESEDDKEFNRLGMKGNEYFNAGFMLIDYTKWQNNNITNNLITKLFQIFDNVVLWDQDVMNSYFDGKYIKLDNRYNFKINLEPESLRTYENSDLKYVNEEVYFVHYSGKFKPWTVRGALHFSSKYYQNYYKKLSSSNYHIDNNWKVQALKDLSKSIFTFRIRKISNPFSFIFEVVKFLYIKR